ncbi:MAG TPA: tetratricopeptide repeat protein, partial [Anaerolineales bacterium]|nr:tetratricopeptide repeat protein [Anaerolineales bacterium]
MNVIWDNQVERWLADELPSDLLLTPLSDEVAKEVVERLKQEADRHWSIDPNLSLGFSDRIVTIGKQQNNPSHIALGLMARGDALKLLGDMQEAWNMLEEAGNLFESVGDEFGWARTRIGRLYISPQLNCVSIALADAERAREIFIRHGNQDKLLRLDWNMGLVYNYLGDQHQALKLFESALSIAKTLGESGQAYIGTLYENIGLTYNSLGNLHQALLYYERARELVLSQNETLRIAQVETGIAEISRAQGHYRSAMALLNSALERVADESPFETAMIR